MSAADCGRRQSEGSGCGLPKPRAQEEAWTCQRCKTPLLGSNARRGAGPPKEHLLLCTLGSRAPPSQATGRCASHCCHLRLQRQPQTDTTTKLPCKQVQVPVPHLPKGVPLVTHLKVESPTVQHQPLPLPPQSSGNQASHEGPATREQTTALALLGVWSRPCTCITLIKSDNGWVHAETETANIQKPKKASHQERHAGCPAYK